MAKEIQRHCWVFTLNNYKDELEPLDWIHEDDFIVWQAEEGESGTPHLQGYIELANKKRLTGMKKMNKYAHWEDRRGTQEQAIKYSSKAEDTTYRSGPFVYGEQKIQGRRNDIHEFVDLVKRKADDAELITEQPEQFLKYHKAVDRIRAAFTLPRTEKPEVRWYWGPTGTGKTRSAFEEFPNAYFKNMSNGKWWDGYAGQDCVILDDMRKDTFKFHELLRLLDRYPLQVEFKGGSTNFNSPIIIITSCMNPMTLYDTREDVQQLIRRIDKIQEFKSEPEESEPEVEGNTKPQLL